MICDDESLMPKRATYGSAGYDFLAPHDIMLEPGVEVFVDTGVRFDGTEHVTFEMEMTPNGTTSYDGRVRFSLVASRWAMQLIPRSGLGTKYGVRFLNTMGLIDMDYRDTIKATLTSSRPIIIKKGERFMQGIFVPVGILSDEIPPNSGRQGGHGSTGL